MWLLYCLLLQSPAPKSQPVVTPTVTIKGPSTRPFGRSVLLKIDAVGDDLKVACFPPNDNWLLVAFKNDPATTGILFDPEKEGAYTFAAATNSGGKSAVAVHTIIIGNPPPPPGPDPGPGPGPGPDPSNPLVKKFTDAYAIDLAAGTGNATHRKLLYNAYKQGSSFINDSTTWNDLFSKQKELNESVVPRGQCPNLRASIAAVAVADLGTNRAAVLDKNKAAATWKKIIDALAQVSP